MLKQIFKFRVVVVMLLMLTVSCPGAFARGNDRGNDKGNDRGNDRGDDRGGDRGYSRGNDRGDHGGYNRGDRHYYRDGRWYKRGWFGWEFVVSALAIGAFIESLPPRHTAVVVEGNSYYHDDRYYYRQIPEGGYVVVSAPVIVQVPSQNRH